MRAMHSILNSARCTCILVLLLVFSASIVFAAQPQFSSLRPAGVQRGTTAELTFGGTKLADVQEILFYTPGFSVQALKAVDDKSVKATVAIAADCKLGIHAIRLRAASGVSNLRTFTVGPYAEITEKEPNNEFNAPQQVSLNSTINGTIQTEDVDYYEIEAKKGQRISAELEGLRLGNSFFDPYLAVLNSSRFELARSDDAALLHQDCLVTLIAPEDGKYILQVRESSNSGSGTYRLHVGSFPRPTAVYPAGGRPGETLPVKLIGDAAGDSTISVTLPTTGDTFGVHAEDAHGIAPSPNNMRVIDLPNTLEAEPNDEFAQATAANDAPLALNGIVQNPGDVDFFRFKAKKGEAYDVRVIARKTLRSPLDSILTIHNDKGNQIASNDDTGSPDSYVRFNVPADGEFLISVRDHLKAGGPTYVYRVELTRVQPELTFSLPERQQYIATTLTIPKNNRMAVMVNAQRTNFGGALKLDFAGLPAGVAAEAVPLVADRNETPVLFNAAADANPSGALVDMIGKTEDPNLKVEGHLHQRTMLVRGQNNNEVWGHSAERMATVVAEEIPFRIDIVPPKAPLVRQGSLDLKIVATRKEGFTAPISVKLLYNPPGISSSASIAIPEGKNEIVIPLTAAPTAVLGTWKIIALGTAPFDNATVECSSQFVDLTVAEQFYTMTFERPAVELGKDSDLQVKLEKKADFEGEGTAELLGLPVGAVSQPVKFTKDTAELVFPLKVEATAKVGKHGGIVCRTVFQVNGENVTHTMGTTELRIDQPIQPKVAPATAAPVANAPAAPSSPMPEQKKRLSRLEQLRIEQEQAAKK